MRSSRRRLSKNLSGISAPPHLGTGSPLSSARRSLVIVSLVLAFAPWMAAQSAKFDAVDPIPFQGTDPVRSNPYGVAFHPTHARVYVALAGEVAFPPDPPETVNGSSVVEVDMGSLEVLRVFTVGFFPTEIAVAPDGSELYVTNSTSGSVSFVDLESGDAVEVPLLDSMAQAVSFPSGVRVSPGGDQLWVVSNGGSLDGSTENVVILERASARFVGTVEIDGGLSRFAVRSDGRVVMPVGFPGGVFPSTPEVRIYDTTAGDPWTELAVLELVVDLSDFPGPVDVVLSPDETRAYVSVLGGSAEVFVVDVDNLVLLDSIVLPGTDFHQHGLGITDDGRHLLVSDFNAARVRVVDLELGGVVATIATGSEPNAIGVRGGRAWITNQDSVSLSVVLLPGGFIRGDTNGSRQLELDDAITLLAYLFQQGPLACLDSGDLDDNGELGLGDALLLLAYQFLPGAVEPRYPFPHRGDDLTSDDLPCD